MKKIKGKKGIAFSFNWIFAIVAGVFILFLAIYGATKFLELGDYQRDVESSAKFQSILNIMGTGMASEKSRDIEFNEEVNMKWDCSEIGDFGEQSLRFGEEIGSEVPFSDKYVFAEGNIKSKKVFALSQGFFMPFKVTDMIVLGSKDYCFYKAPEEIEDNLDNLGLQFTDELDNCTGNVVCFSERDCDINIIGMCSGYGCESKYDYGKIIKDGEVMYYVDNLLYSGIFSSPSIYECNIKRLMKRLRYVGEIYKGKSRLIQRVGCGSEMNSELNILINYAKGLDDSKVLLQMREISDDLKRMNIAQRGGDCELW